MNPALRARRLQAHQLRCQGLTYRQIGERMACAHSTAASYVRAFERERDEILRSLAADLLVHAVAGTQTADSDRHQRHIAAARELRLLLNSVDQVDDRRQKRERRVAREEEADALKNLEALEELYQTMDQYGIDDLTPIIADPSASLSDDDASRPETAAAAGDPTGDAPTPPTAEPRPSDPAHRPTNSAQNRTQSNKAVQGSAESPANRAESRRRRKKNRRATRTDRQPHPQIPIPRPKTRPDARPKTRPGHVLEPPLNPDNLREVDPADPLLRKLFRDR